MIARQHIVLFVSYLLFNLNAFAQSGDIAPCMPCKELKNLDFPEITIQEASTISESNGETSDGFMPHCKVSGIIGNEIRFELLLPNVWNKRFAMGGGGGFVGYVMNRAAKMVHSGFATVGTDTGHEGTDASWGLNNMERQLNFGHLAVHRTVLVSKAIISRYYGTDPAFSYFIGLSRGGGQAMMEAQRYPTDFDGVVAGAPAFDWVGMSLKFIQNSMAIYPDPENFEEPPITLDNLRLLEKFILKQCDLLDGLADSIVNDPMACDFELSQLPVCPNDQSSPDCFTADQLTAIKTVYAAIENIHAGFPIGGENTLTGWHKNIVGPRPNAKYPTNQYFFGIETFRYLIFNDPDWNYAGYHFEDAIQDSRYASSYLDATNPDYQPFKNHGGKMIIYQGWEDPLISALDIIEHYKQARELDPELTDYIRLYMLPGITHIGGRGPGKADWFQAIQDWVEKDIAPERIILSKYEEGEIIMTRPVYPYPDKVIYSGKGNPDESDSFIKDKGK